MNHLCPLAHTDQDGDIMCGMVPIPCLMWDCERWRYQNENDMPVPIKKRLINAYRSGEGGIDYHDLMRAVFPPEDYPRSMNYGMNGGPPGCVMAFVKAIKSLGGNINYRQDGGKTVWLPKKLICQCGWIGSHDDLQHKMCMTNADEWWECPSCGVEAARMNHAS